MAVGNAPLPEFVAIEGIRLGVANAGIKQTERNDLTIIEIAEGSSTAAVFTQNVFCAAPVLIAKQHITEVSPRYLLINTGNANAGTGAQGLQAAQQTVDQLAEKTACQPQQVLPFSTGVIGEPLPQQKIIAALDKALENLDACHWGKAAEAIMTTDTRPKGCTVSLKVADQPLNISGISKGAGMIKPNMATMLAFVAIDAQCSQALLQSMLEQANAVSFNSITVDGDTSTNDSAILISTGKSSLNLDALPADQLAEVQRYINQVFIELAQLIIRDAEGANKFVEVNVINCASIEECRQVAFTVAESPLVKTALFASDANWGRILAAIGRANVAELDIDKVRLKIGEVLVAEHGGRASSYTEAAGAAVMAAEDIVITIDLARGDVSTSVWTSDLSHEYVTINAEYRT
ncbi:MAG: bifunctional glutamate N-acetyltransferase/amino-acid acetyltransferase ArgJ [Pseudomonadales bacterium]|nr:bifunctional glutamate N-acetyltransferase/amino-acid acetyltransferase ArgJ [Pseudomonadales bacterium]